MPPASARRPLSRAAPASAPAPALALLLLCLLARGCRAAGPFAASTLLAVRVASSDTAPACPSPDAACSRATEVWLDEYDITQRPFFGLVRTSRIPGVTLSGTDRALGTLTPCADGTCVVFAAGTDAPGTAPLPSPPFFPAPRVIVRISSDGSVDTSTTIAAAAFNGIIKGVCSFDGSGYWVVGNNTDAACVGYVRHGGGAGGYTVVASGAGCSTADGRNAGTYTSCLAAQANVQGPVTAVPPKRALLFARSVNDYGLVDLATSPEASWNAAGGLQLLGTTTAVLDGGYSDMTYFTNMIADRALDTWWMIDGSPGTCGVSQCLSQSTTGNVVVTTATSVSDTARSIFPAMKAFATTTTYSTQAACSWPQNLGAVQCTGLTSNPAASASADACAAAACSLRLPGWQWVNTSGCWLGPTGGVNTCRPSTTPWVGGGLDWNSTTTGCRTLFTFADLCDFTGMTISRDDGTLYYTSLATLWAHGSRTGGAGTLRVTLPPNNEFRGVAIAPGRCDASGRSPFDGFYCPFGPNSTATRCPGGNYSVAGATDACLAALPTPSSTPSPSATRPPPSATPTRSPIDPEKPCWVASTIAGEDWVTPNNPRHLFFDSKTSAIYVADTGLSEVTEVKNGISSPWVGSSGVRGCQDGIGTNALFHTPNAVVKHATTGDAFITDGFFHVVRRVSSSGVVTTAAGACGRRGYIDGDDSIARFNNPFALAIDSARDRLYVSDQNHVIRVLDDLRGDVQVSTLCGLPQGGAAIDGPGTSSRFNTIYGLALDAARQVLYASDYNNNRIRRIDLATATVSTLAGGAAGLPSSGAFGTNALFGLPTGLAFDPISGKLYIGEFNNAIISVLDFSNLRVTVLAGDGDLTSGVLEGVGTSAKLPFVAGLATDPVSGDLYAALNIHATVVRITLGNANVSIVAGASRDVTDGLGLDARFGHISGMVIDANDNLLVADSTGHTVRTVSTATGAVTTLAGASLVAGFADGAATAARFNRPSGVALNGSATLYVADALNRAIRAYDFASKVVRTVAGGRGAGIVDGAATSTARLNYPAQLVVSGDSVFFLDCVNFDVSFYSPPAREGDKLRMLRNGVVTTLASSVGSIDFSTGGGASAMAVEASTGKVFFADFWNQRVHSWSPITGLSTVVSTAPGWPTGIAFDTSGLTFGTPGSMLVSRWSSWAVLRYNLPPAVASITGLGNAFGGAVNPGSRDGIFGNASAIDGAVALQPNSIAIGSRGDVFIAHSQHGKIVRVGRLAGGACSFANLASSSAHTCRPGTFIDWPARTCRACPPTASEDVFPFSSYCQDPLGRVIKAPSAAADAAVAGISIAAVVGGAVAVVSLLAVRAYYVLKHDASQGSRAAASARRLTKSPIGGNTPKKQSKNSFDEV